MRITESQLRRHIRRTLQEDMGTFLSATRGINIAPDAYRNIPQKRQVKQIWNQEADHNFMKSLVKVHWFAAHVPEELVKRFSWFLNASGKDEVSTTAYLPGERLESSWGVVGVRLEGRVTLAANDMNALVTGYAEDFSAIHPDKVEKWKTTSGVPRRPEGFTPWLSGAYILDRDSFDETHMRPNEAVLDNWRVVSVVVAPKAMKNFLKGRSGANHYRQLLEMVKDKGLPVVDNDGNPLDLTQLIEDLKSMQPRY